MLYLDGRAAGVIEAKKAGATLVGVETQSAKYTAGLPDALPAWRRPLAFAYESTGVETRFTNGFDAAPRSRPVFAFHRPETLADWLADARVTGNRFRGNIQSRRGRARVRSPRPDVPHAHAAHAAARRVRPLAGAGHRHPESREEPGREPPARLIQMATGSGKTFTAVTFIYRLIKFAGARRVLFLVDRGNLGDQTLKEFQQYDSPDNDRKFTEVYNVQHLSSNTLDPRRASASAPSSACTRCSRASGAARGSRRRVRRSRSAACFKKPDAGRATTRRSRSRASTSSSPTNATAPSTTCGAQVLEYFDAFLIGLTATPSKQTFGFFNQNLVMEYDHERPWPTASTWTTTSTASARRSPGAGSTVDAGYSVQIQRRADTRKKRWEQLDDDLTLRRRTSSTATWWRRTRSAPSCARSATSCSPRSSPAARRCRRR